MPPNLAQVAPVLKAQGLSAAVPVFTLHFLAYLLGYMMPKALGFSERTARTVSIESGMQARRAGGQGSLPLHRRRRGKPVLARCPAPLRGNLHRPILHGSQSAAMGFALSTRCFPNDVLVAVPSSSKTGASMVPARCTSPAQHQHVPPLPLPFSLCS